MAVKGYFTGTCELRLVDAFGRVVLSRKMNGGGGFTLERISLEGLTAGSYFVCLVDKNGQVLKADMVVVVQ